MPPREPAVLGEGGSPAGRGRQRVREGESAVGRILVGTSAWSDHASFYPPHIPPVGQFPFYARYFPVIEVNTSY